jgi:hypothetical protein
VAWAQKGVCGSALEFMADESSPSCVTTPGETLEPRPFCLLFLAVSRDKHRVTKWRTAQNQSASLRVASFFSFRFITQGCSLMRR